jgi:SulP family sulfate permease
VNPAQFVREILAGVAASTLQLGLSVSLAFIVFSGPFEAFLPRGIGLAIVGGGLAAAFLGAQTKIPGAICSQQDTPAVVLAAAAAGLATTMDPDTAEDTIFAFVMVVGLAVGLAFILVGRFRLATAARSLPFPVISGFLAGTGWILARAGVEIMVGEELHWSLVPDLLGGSWLQLWLPGLLLAIVVISFADRVGNGLLFPFALVALSVGVHAIGRLGWSGGALRENGWLLGPFPDTQRWSPVGPAELAGADWGAIVGQAVPALGVVGVALISMMLNVAGLEVQLGEDVEVEKEAVRAGVSASLVAALSGYPAYHLISGTVMARTIGSRTPIAAFTILAVCLGVVVAGLDVVALIPRAVVGGVLLTVGLSMLMDWFGQLRTRLRVVDGLLSAAILASIIAFGVLAGIGVGLLAAVLGFVFSYSRIDPVRHLHRLGSSRSVVDRSKPERALLEESAEVMVAIELVGYLFFGSIRKVTDLVSPMLERGELDHLVLDLTAVRGVDASVVQGLHNIQRRTDQSGVLLHWSGLTDAWIRELQRGGLRLDNRHVDLDHALEEIEDWVLVEFTESGAFVEDLTLYNRLEQFCERRTLRAGEVLMDAGEAGGDLFVVESGWLTAWGLTDSGERVRFRRVGRGGVIGEVGFLTGGVRSATVSAEGASCVVLHLTAERWQKLREEDPALVLDIQSDLAGRIAERLSYTSAAYRRMVRD